MGAVLALALVSLVVSSPVFADDFDLRASARDDQRLMLSVPAGVGSFSVLQELLDDQHVLEVAELDAADGLLRLAPVSKVTDGAYTVRLTISGSRGENEADDAVAAFVLPVTVIEGVPAAAGQIARHDLEPSYWHPSDTPSEIVPDADDNQAVASLAGANKGLALPPPADPTTYQSYPCHYISNYVWNYGGDGVPGVSGRVRWPSSTCVRADGPPANRPMMIFTHGRDMDRFDHDYLMAHLARNGIVTVSIANGQFDGGSNEGRARQAISFLNGMHAFWGWSHRLNNRVAFAGHSRGGEAAVTAARMLDDTPALGHEAYDVRAVVSIAPTDGGGGDGAQPQENLRGSMARGFLGLYGSRDADVKGLPIAPWPTSPEKTAFSIYDRAGSEFSSEGFVLAGLHMTKAMVFVDRATHKGFMDADECGNDFAAISCEDHRDTAKAYFNAFLRWQVYNQTQYRGFFNGQWRPGAIAGLDLQQQLSDGVRRVIDNFEQGGWTSSTMNDLVQKSAPVAVLAEDELIDMDPATPHETRGMRIKWDGSGGTPWVRWRVPNVSPFGIGSLRNFSSYSHLSLRVGQNYNDAWNVPAQAQNIHVRLFTSDGWSTKVPLGNYGDLAYPTNFTIFFPDDWSKTTMETIRVPLSAFGNANLSNVSWVALYFDVPGHGSGSVQIDSLELTH